MELFYSSDIAGGTLRLGEDESAHCARVLRHREGDEICVTDGCGSLLRARITDASPKGVEAVILSEEKGFGSHPYRLTMAVCPTKNPDRFEWFAEKAVEIGVDFIVPTIGDHSERRFLKTERLKRLVLSAAKQSLKGRIPQVQEAVNVSDFIRSASGLKLFCHCMEGERMSIKDALSGLDFGNSPEICILIGPEGDFSPAELDLALSCGFKPVHLGDSRLRTETAAVTAVAAVYFAAL